MSRAIAFLHAINVGGRLAANATLRQAFERLGHANVRTFISTGNVVFDLATRPTPAMAKAIERQLQGTLGFEVPCFLRSEAELHAIVKHNAFDYSTLAAAKELHVGFLGNPLTSHAIERLMDLRSAHDQFHVHGREIYWLCRTRRHASTFSPQTFEEALHVPTTFRPFSTLLRLMPWIEAERPSASRLAPR